MKKILTILFLLTACTLGLQADDKLDTYNIKRAIEAIQEGEVKSANQFLKAELRDNPRNYRALYYKAYIYAGSLYFDTSLKACNEALEYLNPKDTKYGNLIYKHRGNIYRHLGDTAKAVSDYRTAYDFDSSDPVPLVNCATMLAEGKRFADMEPIVRQLEEKHTGDAASNLAVSDYYRETGDYDRAVKHAGYAIKLSPAECATYCARARAYMQQRKWHEAADDIVGGLGTQCYIHDLTELLDAMADSSMVNMVASLKTRHRQEPNVPSWTYYLGRVYQVAGKYDEAIPHLLEAANQSNDREIAHEAEKYLTRVYNAKGDFANSMVFACKMLEADSTDLENLKVRINLNLIQGLYDDALTDVEAAIGDNASNYELYSLRGIINYRTGKYEDALRDFTTALHLNSYNRWAYVLRARTHRAMGHEEEAVADFKRCMDTDEVAPFEGEGFVPVVFSLLALDRTTEASSTYSSFCEPQLTSAQHYDRARLLALLGRTDEALDYLEKECARDLSCFLLMQQEPDLESLRSNERYKALVGKYAPAIHLSSESIAPAESFDNIDPALLTTTEIPFTKDCGIYRVNCKVNGLPLSFYFDTGAADITISSVEANFMLKNGYLSKKDIAGQASYGDANGVLSVGTVIVLKEVEFGGLVLENVRASVINAQTAPLLLGQTLLSRLGRIEIDYAASCLKITHKK